jgi:hypothetical protein
LQDKIIDVIKNSTDVKCLAATYVLKFFLNNICVTKDSINVTHRAAGVLKFFSELRCLFVGGDLLV